MTVLARHLTVDYCGTEITVRFSVEGGLGLIADNQHLGEWIGVPEGGSALVTIRLLRQPGDETQQIAETVIERTKP